MGPSGVVDGRGLRMLSRRDATNGFPGGGFNVTAKARRLSSQPAEKVLLARCRWSLAWVWYGKH